MCMVKSNNMDKSFTLNDYLMSNNAICLGKGYTDIVVEDHKKFIRMLYTMTQYKVSSILWWDYHKIRETSNDSLGYGGPVDPANPEYMWSETLIEDSIPEDWGFVEIEKYISSRKEQYKPRMIIPSFSLEER